MAHAFDIKAAHVTAVSSLDSPEIRQARIDLAACLRMAARLGMGEGICNHFSFVVPGHPELFLVNPYGLAFAEVTASSLLICDFHGQVVAGEGRPEATAFFIHAQLHRLNPQATAAFHTHMPNATALCLLEGEPFVWAGQTALKFYERLAVDENYNGLALDYAEGERIARAAGDAAVLMLKNHGPLVLGPSIAEAWDDLYYLERAAEVQLKAMASGRPLKAVSPAIASAACRQMQQGNAESAHLHLESVKRHLLREGADFAE
ncbi:MAG: aldolase [Gammaproteobacteria bacterium]|nr:aldolase [Gammaproteobacteria bacterium]MBU1492269.1 aldolase [Gammaproteobacteria bacterium]MBU2066957.1 aldolase [Gammaproteobacteria bacterium]MBU2139004.1 aldolase [Gammaproteobacteria bacterium]MBU2218771.1 aldolase [Gammaproteobacteria bacterium]